jgi:hypothetical protein
LSLCERRRIGPLNQALGLEGRRRTGGSLIEDESAFKIRGPEKLGRGTRQACPGHHLDLDAEYGTGRQVSSLSIARRRLLCAIVPILGFTQNGGLDTLLVL